MKSILCQIPCYLWIRIEQNIDLFKFEIDDVDMTAIGMMDRGDGIAWSMGDPTDVD